MIFTYMWAFDQQDDWDYIDHVRSIFEPYGTEFYCVELVADPEIRRERNRTENRLLNKPSKRNIEWSEAMNMHVDETYRLISNPGEVPFECYLRIDNSHMPAENAACLIKQTFSL